jgi:hypothetical protein
MIFKAQNKEELFNLQHTSTRNAIKRIFGVLKHRYWILIIPSEYDMKVQVRIPPALAALYNFIHIYDPDEFTNEALTRFINSREDDPHVFGILSEGPPTRQAWDHASIKQDRIAQHMWDDYVAVLAERANR